MYGKMITKIRKKENEKEKEEQKFVRDTQNGRKYVYRNREQQKKILIFCVQIDIFYHQTERVSDMQNTYAK